MENLNSSKIKVLISEKEIQEKVRELACGFNDTYKGEDLYVICVLRGAVMFTVDLVKRLAMPVKMEFVRLSSYGSGTSTSGKVTADNLNFPDLTDKNVLVVEDIVDSGLTAKFLTEYMKKNFRTKSLTFCSLLNKKSRRKVEFEPDVCGFEVEDKFLVGYGMDYDNSYRNLPYIGYIE